MMQAFFKNVGSARRHLSNGTSMELLFLKSPVSLTVFLKMKNNKVMHFLCRNDYLNISNGTNIIGQYCGNLTGKEIRVSHDCLVLTFHTGRRFNQTNRGFEIFFTEDVKMPGKSNNGLISFQIMLYCI